MWLEPHWYCSADSRQLRHPCRRVRPTHRLCLLPDRLTQSLNSNASRRRRVGYWSHYWSHSPSQLCLSKKHTDTDMSTLLKEE